MFVENLFRHRCQAAPVVRVRIAQVVVDVDVGRAIVSTVVRVTTTNHDTRTC